MDPNDTNSPSPITTTTSTTTNTTSATNEKTSSNTSPSTSTKPTSKSGTEDKTMETSKTDSASTDSAMTSNTNSKDKTMDTSNTDSASTTTSNVDPSNTSSPSATSTKDSNKTSADKSMDTTSQNDKDDDNDDEDDDDDDDDEDEDGSGEPRLFSSPPQGLSKVVDSVSDFAARVKSGRSRHSKMIDTDVTENAGDILFETEDESSLAPVFVTHPSMIQFSAPGEPFALVCAAESPAAAASGGEVRYSWTRNGRLMDMADAAARRVFRENAAANGNLIFVSPGTGDVGTYTCLAQNEHGKTYSRGSGVMVRKEEEESEGPKKEIEASNNNGALGEREPRKEGVFLVYPTVVEEAAAQIVEDAGAGIADSIEE